MPTGSTDRLLAAGPLNPADEDRANVARFGTAVEHLHAFAAAFSPEDLVDEESKLTGYDLHVILDLAEKMHRLALDASRS